MKILREKKYIVFLIQKLNRTHKTIEEKIKIVRFAEQNSIHKAAEKYNVDRKNIRSWKSQLPDLITQTNKSTKMIMHSGKKPETEEIEMKLLDTNELYFMGGHR